MRITDFGLLAYWGLSAFMALSLISVPPDWLFKDYHDARIIAWNWSFLPLDVLLSATGFLALRLEARAHPAWPIWSAISMTLTVCAGLMAISFWALTRDFDLAWWGPNLFLALWPLPFLACMATAQTRAP